MKSIARFSNDLVILQPQPRRQLTRLASRRYVSRVTRPSIPLATRADGVLAREIASSDAGGSSAAETELYRRFAPSTLETSCPSFAELAEYWASDSAPADVERIEAHVSSHVKAAVDCWLRRSSSEGPLVISSDRAVFTRS
jgi:hypothetical protein